MSASNRVESEQNVLFMVDISASLTNDEISMALRELNAAIEQFNGMLQGTVGFFGSHVRCAFPITTETELYKHVPDKGGGTDMHCVFDYISRELSHDLPSEIVIMTDGKCDFPEYSATLDIPVLWLLTNNKVRIPWGRAAYFERKMFNSNGGQDSSKPGGFFGTLFGSGKSRRKCNGDCRRCPSHYGYRYGRWYYGHDHTHGCGFQYL